ncbi:MAG TPA: 23S rRNA (pseudouridine(1915)-N(3))-methyltransferase RlmH [Pseudomonadaceae bacterium]|nr:23S rRNA (pseudouridine(1915)-N(3))-methyltransferase RlmH [Pseudomonadaceae bacterium]
MKINLICVGTRMPSWVDEGVNEYRKRLPRDFDLQLTEIPMAQRGKSTDSPKGVLKAMEKEGEACLKAVAASDWLIALDVRGRQLGTESMAAEVAKVRDEGFNLALLVGGPDGLAPACLAAARSSWSLSALTFPHPVVRIVVVEQLYRVWSLLSGHPYHRA